MRRLPLLQVVLACLVTVLFVGCGKTDPTGTVKGKVTLDDAPYTGDGSVVFMSTETSDSEDGMEEPSEEKIDKSLPAKYRGETSTDIKIDITEGDNDVTVPLVK
jgi:type IV pilus biogenesis protein CpaD/CtpE